MDQVSPIRRAAPARGGDSKASGIGRHPRGEPGGRAVAHAGDHGQRHPEIGQHTDEVLGEVGYSAADIAALRKNKVI